MLRHQPVLAQEILDHLPIHFLHYFDGTFGHGGHVEYLLNYATHHPEKVKVIACDLDEQVMQRGL
ncbi:MAG: 16S rRNA (cytosine(1402)-N(4))-methyltransferase [Candidatus Absconditabacteria bacterium]|nr:16S rRNA (cytosine(1402)-N(4))-methyltransferase [Candidatus Absconditabacteria bacterium]MDD4714032.1 16S rRNA (cytosine(1402)-N(4))-methyltransferase [Candidatus Absconditabacteria bacterium]